MTPFEIIVFRCSAMLLFIKGLSWRSTVDLVKIAVSRCYAMTLVQIAVSSCSALTMVMIAISWCSLVTQIEVTLFCCYLALLFWTAVKWPFAVSLVKIAIS